MNDRDESDHDMNDHDDRFEEDELMRQISRPPEFPPATREQIEQSWQAIVDGIAGDEAAAPARDAHAHAGRRWWHALLPPLPASGDWQLARVAALLVIGFGAAWIASSRGWLPGTAPIDEMPPVTASGDDPAVPDRTWLAANDYSDRLEALLLGVAKGDDAAEVAPAARQVSRRLLNDSRFYQRVARDKDDRALADLLSRIEIVLLALATAPEGQEQEVIGMLREFIAGSGVLDELRSVQTTVPDVPRRRAAQAGS